MVLVPSYAYYSNVYVPSVQPQHTLDPFTTLWNGQAPSLGFSQIASSATCVQNVNCQVTVTTKVGSLLVAGVICTAAGIATFSDSQANSFTGTNRGPAAGFTLVTYTATDATAGSDTVTMKCTTALNSAFAISVYNGGTGFGNSNQHSCGSACGSAGTDSLSLTVSAKSIIWEMFMIDSSAACGAFSISPASSQTIRLNNMCFLNGAGPTSVDSEGLDSGPVLAGAKLENVSWTGATVSDVWVHTLIEIQGNFPSGCSGLFNCVNAKIGSDGNILLSPNSTTSAVAVSTSAVDLSTAAAKSLAFSEQTNLFGGFASGGNNQYANEQYGWFLTLNSTGPGHNIGTSASWNPLNDSSVVLYVEGFVVSGSTENFYVYMQRQVGQTLQILSSNNPYPTCPQSSSLYICVQSSAGSSAQFLMSLVANFTGGQTGGSCNSNGLGPSCSYLCLPGGAGNTCTVGGTNNNFVSYANVVFAENFTQPWLNLQNQYYLGFWTNPNPNGNTVKFLTSTANPQNNVISIYLPTPPANPQDTGGFFGWVGRALGGAWNAAGGVLASIPGVSSLLGIGNSLLAAFISALIQAGNLLIGGLSVLESLLVTALNAVGNFVGLGPIGTNIQTVINSFITFFTNGAFSGVLGYIGNVFTVMFNRVTVALAWVAFALTTILNVATWLVNGVAEVVTISTKVTLVVAGLFAVLLMLLWFMDLGDYGASGGLVWLNTAEWLVLGTGIRFVTIIINFGIDIISGLISLVPKPFVQMHNIPGWMRVPGVETSAQPTFPDGHMQAIRDLNIFAISGWLVGFVFFIWFESTNLPGTIGAAVAGAQPNLTPLSTLLPVYYILLLLLGVSFLAFLPATLTNAIPQIFGDRQGKKETGFSFRAEAPRVSGGFGLRLSRRTAGVGRFQSRVERKRMEARERRSPAEKPSAEGVG